MTTKEATKVNTASTRNRTLVGQSQMNPYGTRSSPFLLYRMSNNTDVKNIMSKSNSCFNTKPAPNYAVMN